MIYISKPKTAPTKLNTDGKIKALAHIQDFNQDPQSYQSGKKKFNFSSDIYGHSSVKAALIVVQHQKCCFCERLVGEDGDVEHFRPKSAYVQKKGGKLNRPGYYWLAYNWDNLYLSCSACNQRQKRNLFPLVDPSTRADSHLKDIRLEEPIFVNPGVDEPSEHLRFRGEVLHLVSNSPKGKATIQALNLNRNLLNEARLKHLQKLKTLHQLLEIAGTRTQDQELQKLAAAAKRILEEALSDQGEFAAATRAASKNNFKFVIG